MSNKADGRRFGRAEGGNVAMTFALALFPIVAIVGLGVDVAFDLNAKTVLDAAADAAALSAATTTQARLAAGDSQAQAKSLGVAAGNAMFAANTAKLAQSAGTPTTTINVSVDTTAMTVGATVGYSAQISTVFGQMFGVGRLNLSRSAAGGDLAIASIGMAKFLQTTFAIDNSQSMGIGSTQNDIDRLTALTGCALGCHYTDPGQTISNEQVAHNNGIRMRIDAVKDAVKKIIGNVQTDQASFNPKRESFAMYTMVNEKVNNSSLVPVKAITSSPSTDYSALLTLADNIDLAGFADTGRGETAVGMGLRQLVGTVGSSGDGATQASPKKYLFVLTDGVEDLMMPQSEYTCRSSLAFDSSHCTAPFNPANCDQFKQNGVTVAVIYTTYLQVPFYANFVQPFAGEIVPNLQACASGPQWFAEASDGPAIDAALQNFYQQARVSAKLTQ